MIDDKEFLRAYFERYRRALFESDVTDQLISAKKSICQVKEEKRKLILVGNGGSAAIALHAAVDFTKQAGVRAISPGSGPLLTAFANDYGYEHWVAKYVEHWANAGDVVVAISSSGSSRNIVNGAAKARELGLQVMTFSGFSSDNPLRNLGTLDFWLDSRAYNVVENTHQIWLLSICDLVIGEAEYSVS